MNCALSYPCATNHVARKPLKYMNRLTCDLAKDRDGTVAGTDGRSESGLLLGYRVTLPHPDTPVHPAGFSPGMINKLH